MPIEFYILTKNFSLINIDVWGKKAGWKMKKLICLVKGESYCDQIKTQFFYNLLLLNVVGKKSNNGRNVSETSKKSSNHFY